MKYVTSYFYRLCHAADPKLNPDWFTPIAIITLILSKKHITMNISPFRAFAQMNNGEIGQNLFLIACSFFNKQTLCYVYFKHTEKFQL